MNADTASPVFLRTGISRLRLRLAAVYALTFIVSLALVAAGSLGWLMHESTRRLDGRLSQLASGVSRAIALEQEEYPDASLQEIVDDVRREWVLGPDSWLVLDASGTIVSSTTDTLNRPRVLAGWQHAVAAEGPFDVDRDGEDLRVMPKAVRSRAGLTAFTILAVASTEGIERDSELLAVALAVATPLIAFASLVGGYLLSRWALRPTDTLSRAIDELEPSTIAARLPVPEPVDEVGNLARRFNALLDRLAASQAQNREFVREAAHQIRTPLTLVRGEAEHALAAETPGVPALQDALQRIARASQQMQRRVDELLLLAEAEAGAVLEQRTAVELDTLALEGVDLFRARAAQFRRPLAYGVLEPATVMGDAALLREALLELLENACRHGSEGTPIAVSVCCTRDTVELTVESHRSPTTPAVTAPPRTGIGQRIVGWIAEVHDGRFSIHHELSGNYAARITLPASARQPDRLAPSAPHS